MTYKNYEGYPDPTSGRAKNSEKVRKPYWVVELYRYCVLLEDEKGYRTAPSYIQLQSLMRGGD